MSSDLNSLFTTLTAAGSSSSGGGWLLIILILSMVFTVWKLPWAASSPRFQLAGKAVFIHLAIGPVMSWLLTWSPPVKPPALGFLGMLQGLALAAAFLGFLTALASRRQP